MRVKKRINKHVIFVNCLLLLLVLTMISSIMVVSGVSAYVPEVNKNINIVFTEGSAGTTAIPDSFFTANDTQTATVNSSECIILEDGYFSGVSVDSAVQKYDNETFVFTSDGWAYSFTGWHIKGATQKVPGTTVFQPGDVITPDVLSQYVDASTETLTLEALWGKCYFIRNAYDKIEYSYITRHTQGFKTGSTTERNNNDRLARWYFFDAEKSAEASGKELTDVYSSDQNSGKTPSESIATLDVLYAKLRADSELIDANGHNPDAYNTVIMLTGDINYMKDNDIENNYFGYRSDNFDYFDPTAIEVLNKYKNTSTSLDSYADEQTLGFRKGAGLGISTSNAKYTSATYKSLDPDGDGSVYNIEYKPGGNSCPMVCNIRFDNVNVLYMDGTGDGTSVAYGSLDNRFEEKIGYEYNMYYSETAHGAFDHYFEFTHRMNQQIPSGRRIQMHTVRPHTFEYCVINGGGRINGVHNSYSYTYSNYINRVWRFGRNANINTVLGGNESNNQFELVTIPSNYTYYITGGNFTSLYGGCRNQYSITVGHRDINILGDAASTSSNIEYFPKIGNLYGGGMEAKLYGNIDIDIKNANITGSVYGGGDTAFATVYGAVNLSIKDSIVAGSVYGGGKNGNTEKVGDTYYYYKYQSVDVNGNPIKDAHNSAIEGAGTAYESIVVDYIFNIEGTDAATDIDSTLGVESGNNIPLAGYANVKDDIADVCGKITMDIESSKINGSVYGSGTGSTSNVFSTNMAYLTGRWSNAQFVAGTSLADGCFILDGNRYKRLVDFSKYTQKDDYLYYTDGTGRFKISGVLNMSDYTDNGDGTCTKDGKTYNFYTVKEGTGTWDRSSIQTWVDTAPSGFPEYDASTGAIVSRKYKRHARNNEDTALSYMETSIRSALSIATVQSVDMNIHASEIGKNVYGGGAIAKVYEDTNITVTGQSNIKGIVFGGGDGTATPAKVRLYTPSGAGSYTYAPIDFMVVEYDTTGRVTVQIFPVQSIDEEAMHASTYGDFTWTADEAVLAMGGIDYDNKLVYSPNMNDFGTVGGDTHVTIENGTVYRVVGGGNQGNVFGDTNVTVENGTIGGGLDYQAIFGAGNYGDVYGDTNLHITGGTLNGYVYGGSQLGKIKGNVNVTLDGGTYKDYFFAGSRAGDIGTEGDSNTGNITTVVNDATFSPTNGSSVHFIGGNNSAGTVYGNMITTINAGTFYQTHGGNNGDGQDQVSGSTGANTLGDVIITLNGGTFNSPVYGGSNNAGTQKSCAINVNCVTKSNVFGGGWGAKHNGTATVNVNNGAKVGGSVHGGGNAAASHVENVVVNINNGGKVVGDLCGGGYKGTVGTTRINLKGSVDKSVYGGGWEGKATGKASIYLYSGSYVSGDLYGGGYGSAATTGEVYIWSEPGSFVYTWFYGGGRYGAVNGPVDIDIEGGTFRNYFIGGGFGGSVASVDITVTGGSICSGSGDRGMIGGGYEAGSKVLGDVNITIDGGTHRDIFGGSYDGTVNGNVNITVNGGTFKDDTSQGSIIYGGCDNGGTVSGNVTINMNHSGGVDGVYGGGRGTKPVTTGDIIVNVDCDGENIPFVYGGGENAKINNAVVNIKNGTVPAVYGGGNKGPATGNTTVNISGDTVTNTYGGGNNGTVAGNTTVNVTGGSVTQAFGGGNGASAVVSGDSFASVSGGTVADVYGGGNAAKVNGNSSATISNGTVTNAFGGGNGETATVSGSANLSLKGGTVEYVYGGGNKGTVEKDVNFTATGGTVVRCTYCGANQGAILGNINADISGGTFSTTPKSGNNEDRLALFGGSRAANVGTDGNADTGNITLNISNGKFSKAHMFGGNNASGTVYGDVTINFTGGTNYGEIYGGNNGDGRHDEDIGGSTGADILGDVTLNINGGTFPSNIYGGCNNIGTIAGDIFVNVNSAVNSNVYGGGYGTKHKTVYITVSETGTVGASVLGGGNNAKSYMENANIEIRGTVNGNVFGGGNKGSIGSSCINAIAGTVKGIIYGGGNQGAAETTEINLLGTAASKDVYGGGNNGNIITSKINASAGTVTNNIYGGGNKGTAETTEVNLLGTTVKGNVYGGGNNGNIITSKINASAGTVTNNVYGGGNQGTADTTEVNLLGTTVNGNVYGGGNNGNIITSKINASAGTVTNNIYGGGNQGAADTTEVNLLGTTVTGDVYGGGNEGDVVNTKINTAAGTVNGNLYGGGNNGDVDNTTLNIHGGTFKQDINGGGKNGTARATETYITDEIATFATVDSPVIINGNVYGGGEGVNATVFEKTKIDISLDCDFDVTEIPFTTSSFDTQSGQSVTTVTNLTAESRIDGNVYGGGDRGMVGKGNILSGMNKANITTEGSAKVTVNSGYIGGSVFGGGRGKPGTGETYNLYMGAVFGSTDVVIGGGYIGADYSESGEVGSVYGGGEQSRVYGIDGQAATNVTVDSNLIPDSKTIISGSVFGGGDRGSDTAINASVPTVIGDSNVNITGNSEGTPIYFLTGGVYGDGNLCLVSGKRTINITDFVTETDGILKTFYSIQRADVVNLNNAEIVLLGAVDLVEEGDDTLYSINRVGQLYMNDGSTIKLDRIVKYLGGLESDIDTERPFLNLGNNGTNDYTDHGGDESVLDILNSQNSKEVEEYIRKDVKSAQNDNHNILCVANGLYVDVMKEDGSFGPVTGLFTLQLLYAEPGVGGGFVYGDIETSTGDFICTTEMSGNPFSDVNVVDGVTYMGIIDNVGKLSGTTASEPYDYYYWYINGGTVYSEINLVGYLGTGATEFSKDMSIPSHSESYRYVLEDINGLDTLKDYIESGHPLVQTDAVTGNQIAVEFRIGGESVGFVEYTDGVWNLVTAGGTHLSGLDGVKESDDGFVSKLTANTLITTTLVEGNNTFECVFHKSKDINETIEDLAVNIELKVFKDGSNSPPDDSAHVFNITSNIDIRRINPTQSIYYESIRNYMGLSSQIPVHITKESSFTTEIKTRYVPTIFPKDENSTMSWYLEADTALPKGTKLSFIDMSGSVPTYYYYICEGGETSINLLDFMQMGTEIKISELAPEKMPAFITNYEQQKGEIITERLLFVTDFLQVSDWTWTNKKFTGNLSLTHKYDDEEMMDYSGSEGALSVEYTVYSDEVGVSEAADGFTAVFDADSYPDNGTALLDVTIIENDVAVDTRYYEGDFAIKLELVDADTDTVLEMPRGISFTVDGKTYLAGSDNKHAIVPVSGFGSYQIGINNAISGIKSAVGSDTTVKFRATLYSAPEPTYYNSIDAQRTSADTYTIASAVEHALKVKTKSKAERGETVNLILSPNDKLVFDLQTYSVNDVTSVVNVEAYKKTDKGYTERVPLTKLFANSSETLAPTTTVKENSWDVIAGDGLYRLVFTYGERTEYLYIIIE